MDPWKGESTSIAVLVDIALELVAGGVVKPPLLLPLLPV